MTYNVFGQTLNLIQPTCPCLNLNTVLYISCRDRQCCIASAASIPAKLIGHVTHTMLYCYITCASAMMTHQVVFYWRLSVCLSVCVCECLFVSLSMQIGLLKTYSSQINVTS